MQYLEVKNIVCGYDHFKLKDVSFNIKEGSFTGIIGPNGSGKTTLLKSVLGDIRLEKGSIRIDGKDLAKMSIKERSVRIAVVTQKVGNSDFSVIDYVLMGRLPYRRPFQFFESDHDLEVVEKYMKLTGIEDLRDKSVKELSGGERQLVSIAKALAQEPEILLLDEATSQLDISHQIEVLDLVRELNESMNLTVLMIIHDLNLASEYCDNLLMMNKGMIHSQGSPEEVIEYQAIEDVYKTCVITRENPVSGKPAVFLVSKKNKIIKT